MMKEPSRLIECVNARLVEMGDRHSMDAFRAALGFRNPKTVEMLLSCEIKWPIDRLRQLGGYLEMNPKFLFWLGLEQYGYPDLDIFIGPLNEIDPELPK